VIDGERRTDSVEHRPRHFGVVPADRSSSWQLAGAPDIQLVYLRRSMVDRIAEEHFGFDSSRIELLPKLGSAMGCSSNSRWRAARHRRDATPRIRPTASMPIIWCG